MLELEQLMLGFLWCQGEMRKGKARVAWEAVCLPKKEGDLGIHHLEAFNKALITSHIWSLLNNKESLWVKCICTYKLNGRSFWDIPLCDWVMVLRPQLGLNWCSLGPLAERISNRDIYGAGFRHATKINNVIDSGLWRWPLEWVLKYPNLFNIAVPNLSDALLLFMKNADPDGTGSVREKLLSIRTTEAMDDLSVGIQGNYLEHPISASPVAPPGQQVPPEGRVAHAALVKGQKEVAVLMLLTMDLEIQQNLAHLGAYDMLQELKSIFVQNYNIHGIGKTVNELHAMLKLHEETLPKKDVNPALHAIRARRVQKNQKNKSHKAGKGSHGKGKGKMGNALNNASFASKSKTPPPPKKDNPVKDAISTNVVKLGIGEGTGLRGSKKLKPGALSLYVGDGHRTAVEAIGTFHLELPSGLVIVLNNCHYAPSITRGVISVSRLFDDGFVTSFDDNNVISVSKNNMVYFKAIPRDGKCVSCMSGKMARKPFSHQMERAKDLLGLIHTDVCGPFKIVSRQEASYFVTFTDDFSRYGYVYLLKHKHEVFETFKVFQKEVENQLGKTIKSLRSDRKEKRNRTLLDMVRSMMSQTTLPKSFWDYALENAARILNMVPTKKVEKKLYEIWHGQAPKLSYLKVWGCEAFVKRDTLTKPDKLDPRSFKYIIVGYPKETMGYSFYSLSENKVFVARNAEFFESKLLDLKESGSVEDLELIRRYKSFYRMSLYIDAEEHELGDLGEPANYKAALLDPESKKWLDAMNMEMKSMKDNDVWVLVELPPNARTVGSKWLFKKKTNIDDIRAIRILIAIPAYYDYEIWQMDVKTAFLNGHLSEENMTSRFQQNPSEEHWTAVKNILKYLRNTKDMFL
nr:hypothetical protein [Tanacetum cinerariifolium]